MRRKLQQPLLGDTVSDAAAPASVLGSAVADAMPERKEMLEVLTASRESQRSTLCPYRIFLNHACGRRKDIKQAAVGERAPFR